MKVSRLLLLLLLMAATACSATTPAQPTPQPTAAPTTAAAPPQVLTLWHSWSGRAAQALDLIARRYEQNHPDVRISLRSRPAASLVRDYSSGVADGSAPQMLLVRSRYLGELAEHRYILPLQEKSLQDRLGDLWPAAVESGRIGGVLHAVPVTFDSLVLFYDRRQMPQPPKTLDDAIVFAPPQATASPERSWGLAYYLSAPTTLPYLKVFGGNAQGPGGTPALDAANRAGALRWLEWLQALHAGQRTTATDDFGAVDALIQSNRVAAAVDWSHRLADYQRLWGEDAVGLAPLPGLAGQNAAPTPWLLADAICVNTVTSQQQRTAAVDFLAYLVSASAQELLWSRGLEQPVNRRAEVDGAAKALSGIVASTVAFPNSSASARAWPMLDEMVRSVLAGSATPAEAFDKAAAGLRALPGQP